MRSSYVRKTVLVAVVVAVAGCGGNRGVTKSQADALIARQVQTSFRAALYDRTNTMYDVTMNCITTDDSMRRFSCDVSATNPGNPADYAESSISVTCEEQARNCQWRSDG